MTIRIDRIILAVITCLALTSCSKAITGLYGMKSIKEVDEKTVLKYGKKYDIPNQDSYLLDTAYYSFLFSLDSAKYKSQIKNHYQPLQALYYDSDKGLQSFQVNCCAGGFPNLEWNNNGIFDSFPPKKQASLDSIVPIDTQLKYLAPFSQTETISIENFDYVVIVHWSRFMGRQSKRLIKFVQDNTKLSGSKNVKIIYANNDNYFAQGK